jgi:hypothetical protein
LLTEFNGSVVVFRGIDGTNNTLMNPSFFRLRTPSPQGPLLVSSTYAGGAVQWIHVEVLDTGLGWFTIESTMPAPWGLASTNPNGQLAQVALTGLPGTVAGTSRYNVSGLQPGDNATLYSVSNPPSSLTLGADEGCPSNYNFWGTMFASGGGGSSNLPVPASGEMQIAPCNNGSSPNASQAFTWVAVDGDWVQLVLTSTLSTADPLCLTVSSCSPSEDASVFMASCMSSSPSNSSSSACYDASSSCGIALQLWNFNSNYQPNGLQSQVQASSTAWCLDMPGAYGPTVDLYTCDTNNEQFSNQDWTFDSTTGAVVSLLSRPGWGPGYCLTVPSA